MTSSVNWDRNFQNLNHLKNDFFFSTLSQMAHLCFQGEDTMTGDGGEYLRAEDLRELGDDSLPGHYLDGFSYTSHNLDRSRVAHTYSHLTNWHAMMHVQVDRYLQRLLNSNLVFQQAAAHSHSPKLPSERRSSHWRHAHKPPGEDKDYEQCMVVIFLVKPSKNIWGYLDFVFSNWPADVCWSVGVSAV